MGSDKEANPQLQNSDWYVVCRFLVYCNISTGNMRNEFFYNLFIGTFIHEAVQASLAAWMFYQFHRFTGRCSSVYFKIFTSTKENINL